MDNQSGLKPLGRAVLVRPYEPEKLSSLILMPEAYVANMSTLEQNCVVVALGEACWPEEPPRAKAGDHVIVAKFAGHQRLGVDGKQYRLVNDRDLFCQIIVPDGLDVFAEALHA